MQPFPHISGLDFTFYLSYLYVEFKFRTMKTSSRLFYLLVFILAAAGLSSCTKVAGPDGIGTAEFSINLPDGAGQLKSATADSAVVSFQLLISVADAKGNLVLNDKLIPLYTFGTGFLSAKIEINAGEFKLIKFMVMNPSGAIVYAAPVAGSPLAYLTTKPLPITFIISADKVTSVLPEVLVVGTQSPSQFGYATFGVQIINPLDFFTVCIIDNPSLTTSTQMTTARLTISNNNGWIYSFNLIAGVNHLIIRGGSENYTFGLEKEGYVSQKFQFTGKQLLAATKENPLVLKLPYQPVVTQILFLQPGPDGGKDAMISNIEPDKNFGTYQYFEATYMTAENALTVMRSRRSLLWFDMSTLPKSAIIKKVVLKLFYDVPIPWDSTIVVPANSVVKPAGLLQQIVEPWEESKVTWNNQPKTTEVNQMTIVPFVRNVNYIEVDVTSLFVSTSATALPNYGMLFKLTPTEKFKGFRFASSDFTEASMRPKLSVQYTLPQ